MAGVAGGRTKISSRAKNDATAPRDTKAEMSVCRTRVEVFEGVPKNWMEGNGERRTREGAGSMVGSQRALCDACSVSVMMSACRFWVWLP